MIQFCLFASTPDVVRIGFIVKVLTGTPAELCRKAVEWGYDGIEFMPDPDHVPSVAEMKAALSASGAALPVVNSGRMAFQGYALLDYDPAIRAASVDAFKRLLDFAGEFGARVGLGASRGSSPANERIAEEVFFELAEHAVKAGTVVMLEPADPGITACINSMDEAMIWVDRLAHPGFSVMMDTYELSEAEPSVEHGIRAARGAATHIHLYDPSRWPPGIRPESERMDWQRIARILEEERFQGSASVVLVPEGDPARAAQTTSAFLRRTFAGVTA